MDGKKISKELLAWYDANKRELPWRHAPEPYGVWISEIMAQQTQMERVVQYWKRWMERYPDLTTLAGASEEEVLKSWEGLGYYSRARNIRKAAALIMDAHNGVFPNSFEEIRSLPGIGEYTAGAISSIALGIAEPAIDANVLRVFSRLLNISMPMKEKIAREQVESAVRNMLPADRPGDFNQALMEFGALICGKRPHCSGCPVQFQCQAYAEGVTAERPVLPPKKSIIKIEMATGVFEHNGKMLIQKRKPDDVWPGLWEFPGGVIEEGETPEQALAREYSEEVELDVVCGEKITVISYAYTRYRVTMHCYLCRSVNEGPPEPVFNEAVEGGFVLPSTLSDYAFPAGHRRLVEFMRKDMRFADRFLI
ncbi:A/G-specific adenine glycosylase [Pseudodesulfovibrio sp. zrk46]|uniref:A/G-specific adenine glycosylase n=1 Tax=Pseudodesulfovibrio sp. zrk46 TaxID=2725288 RepID=UPI001448F078|nr:A/G-specific adenine glycosylase [Pseudodesulfovibrio sp. zrk46]QJB58012.1 A/G-specific adenine glycosylase [Pseudodesulfovibrio sp. zrk46]